MSADRRTRPAVSFSPVAKEMMRLDIGDIIVTMRDGATMAAMADAIERRLMKGDFGDTEAAGLCMTFNTVVAIARDKFRDR